MGVFGAHHGRRGMTTVPKTYRTYPAMMKLGPIVPYLKKIQKLYESCDTPLQLY